MNFKSFKFWVNLITITALVLLIVFARQQIGDAIRTVWTLNFFWLFLIIPVQIGNYLAIGKFYQSYLKTLGEKIKLKDTFKVGLEMNFVNNVFPSGGLSGFGYLGLRLKQFGIKGSKTTLLQTSRHMLTFLSFIFYLVLALLLLSIFGSASRLIVLIASTLSSIIIFGSLILIYIISNEDRITQFTAALPRLINRVVRLLHAKNKQPINIDRIESLFRDLHKDYKHVRKNWKDLRYPFLWTMVMNFTEILTIFIVYLSFGELVNPGAIIISYAVANMAGLVAILPGGVGVYESLMTTVMTSAGIRNVLALSATVVYRVLNMALFLPPGYFLYQRALKDMDVEEPDLVEAGEEEVYDRSDPKR